MRPTVVRLVAVSVGAFAVVGVCALAFGQTVPGEKWKQKISVSMEGMTMPMGGGEICAPVGRTEDLMKPDKDCTMSDVKVVGDTTSGRVTCGGKDAMTGTVQLTAKGDTVSGRAQMKTADGDEMVMLMEMTKLGPCQAIDSAAVAAKAKATADAIVAAQPKVDPCSSIVATFEKDPSKAGAVANLFVDRGQLCATTPANPAFCGAIQKRGGFSSLVSADARAPGLASRSVAACGLGQGGAGVDALRTRLVRAAEAEGDGDFLVAHAPARAKEIARSECVIKGEMWGGKNAKWDRFCDSNFAADARGGR